MINLRNSVMELNDSNTCTVGDNRMVSIKQKIIIVGNGYKNSISDDFFKDVIDGKCENAQYYFFWEVKNPIISFFQRIYYTRRWKLVDKFPYFKRFFKKYNAFERIKKNDQGSIVVLNLASQYSNMTTKEELMELKKSNVVLILFCIDSIDSPQMNYGEILSWFPLFDYVISDNPADAEKYNLIYHLDPYPWQESDLQLVEISNDLFFLGRGKDRVVFCKRLISLLSRQGVKCDFTIIGEDGDEEQNDGIKYLDKKVPYTKIIDGISKSNCILEVLSYGNDASLRYFEAIVFNKKLITTNRNVSKLPYYNSKYMKVIENPDDIDVDWIIRRENVDYGYRGDFSPARFIEDVRAIVTN